MTMTSSHIGPVVANDQVWPKISIVTPSFNQAEFLERTIASVLSQNYPNIEYIIIDGGSTDGGIEIIRKYEKHLAYWVSEPDKGQSEAINKGFAKSTGEILAWLCSDDFYLPGALFKVADMFKKHPDAALIYGDYIKVDADDRCIALRRQPSFDYRVCLYFYGIVIQPASFFNRKAFFDVGGVDTSLNYVMDYDLIIKLARYGRVLHMSEYLATLRVHPASKTVIREKLKLPMESCRIRLRYLRHAPLPGELFILRWYHTARIVFRMLREGCLASRFGRDQGDYELGKIYTPRPQRSHEND